MTAPALPPLATPTTAATPAPAAAEIAADVVVIGAGPVGLFQVFQLGLQGLQAHLIDALPHLGGQCSELYPDKPIYDIPGIQACTGQELVDRLRQQIAPFAPTLHLGQQVQGLVRQADGRFLLSTDGGTRLLARAVVIAAGVGAFVPRSLKLEGIEPLVGHQVHYHPAPATQPALAAGLQVLVHGGDAAAVAAAIACAGQAAGVTLLYRRDVFQAPEDQLAQLQALRASGRIQVVAGQPAALELDSQGQLQGLDVALPDGSSRTLPVEQLLVFLGISPKLGPIADWGLALDRKQLAVDTAAFATAEPGIFAVGDINTYPGKRKLILCGFHEATLAGFAVAEHLTGQSPLLQYTTTSTRLHALLGVPGATPAP